jgi:hypothetical protein
LTGNSPIIAAFALWVASWTNALKPVLPIGAVEWVLWQYTNKFQIAGIGYDASRFHGNEAAFEEYVRSLNGVPSPDCCEEMLARIEAVEQVNINQSADIATQEQHLIDANEEILSLKLRVTESETYIIYLFAIVKEVEKIFTPPD